MHVDAALRVPAMLTVVAVRRNERYQGRAGAHVFLQN